LFRHQGQIVQHSGLQSSVFRIDWISRLTVVLPLVPSPDRAQSTGWQIRQMVADPSVGFAAVRDDQHRCIDGQPTFGHNRHSTSPHGLSGMVVPVEIRGLKGDVQAAATTSPRIAGT
jgi:hypothetical protein